MKKVFAVIVLLIAAGLIWLVWFRPIKSGESEPHVNPDVPVHVGKLSRATLHAYVTAYGPVESEPAGSARVATPVPGVVAAVKCVEGQKVEQGALLFQLDSRAADVAVNFAEKSLDRQKKLAQVEGTSQKLLQDAEQQFAAARAQQALLGIHSPLAGTVTRVNIKAGEAADLTTVLAEVVDLDRLVINASVPSAELTALKAGQPFEVVPDDSTNTNIVSGSVTYISSQVDAKTGSAPVRAKLPPNAGLRPGQLIKIRIVSAEHKDCLAVPLASVARDAAGASFIALVQGEKAVLKPVKTGLRDGELVEVEADGLEADAPIVTEGAYGLVMTQQFATKIRVLSE
jgi:membrane fusion protein (multidrug efflux system)